MTVVMVIVVMVEIVTVVMVIVVMVEIVTVVMVHTSPIKDS